MIYVITNLLLLLLLGGMFTLEHEVNSE